ncbi:hypothetical protein TNCV_4703951 [Trichonephila clavipes]|nr:hypothetical protein TNCV_4703951 [Trichonephila clavipes]
MLFHTSGDNRYQFSLSVLRYQKYNRVFTRVDHVTNQFESTNWTCKDVKHSKFSVGPQSRSGVQDGFFFGASIIT